VSSSANPPKPQGLFVGDDEIMVEKKGGTMKLVEGEREKSTTNL